MVMKFALATADVMEFGAGLYGADKWTVEKSELLLAAWRGGAPVVNKESFLRFYRFAVEHATEEQFKKGIATFRKASLHKRHYHLVRRSSKVKEPNAA